MSQLSHAQFPLRRHPDLLVDHRRARSAAVAEPRGANAESRDRLRWPASFRNGGRHQIGTVADIKSEAPAGLNRNSHWLWRRLPRYAGLIFRWASRSRRSVASCVCRARWSERSFARTRRSSIMNERDSRFPRLGHGESDWSRFLRTKRADRP